MEVMILINFMLLFILTLASLEKLEELGDEKNEQS